MIAFTINSVAVFVFSLAFCMNVNIAGCIYICTGNVDSGFGIIFALRHNNACRTTAGKAYADSVYFCSAFVVSVNIDIACNIKIAACNAYVVYAVRCCRTISCANGRSTANAALINIKTGTTFLAGIYS